jgi:DNA helicase HerA-like ATPase
MVIELVALLGLAAGLIGIADTIPYVRDTLKGTTRPHRGTWLIWGVLAILVSLSQYADGAAWSLVMAGVQAVLTSLIFLLSLRRGEGGLSRTDLTMIAIAAGGVVGWILAEEPIVATACVVAADLIGAAMMVPKTYRDPDSETLITFAFASLAGALAAGAVGSTDASLLLYPVYYCLINAAIALLIHQRRAATGR